MPLTDLVRYFNARNRERYQFADAQQDSLSFSGTRITGHYAGLALSSVFQPLVALPDGQVVGHEALLRAHTQEGKALTPESVFVIPSDAHEVVYLDRLARTLHALNFLQQPERGDSSLFLNIHPRHLVAVASDHGLVFEEILRRLGLTPRQVVLEILEAAIDDLPRLKEAVGNFRQRGYRIALDDFGRGHANLDRLWQLSPDIVKFDRTLIDSASRQLKLRHSLPKLVALVKDLGAQVAFEGVETPDHLNLALESGADLAQGYLIATPAADCQPAGRVLFREPPPSWGEPRFAVA